MWGLGSLGGVLLNTLCSSYGRIHGRGLVRQSTVELRNIGALVEIDLPVFGLNGRVAAQRLNVRTNVRRKINKA